MKRRILSNKTVSGKVYAKWTLSALTLSYILILIFTVAEYFVVQRRINYLVTLMGFSLYLTGLLGREAPVKKLRGFWSPNIEIREDQRLIKDGLYQYVRHPYYLFLLIEILGFTLIPNTYYTFLCCLIFYTYAVYVRIYYEEKALIEKFGQEYIDYKRDVSCLIPLKFKGKQ
jgi:protein-S-isoprenylcysteine O-methyltransferase Ste14